VASMLLKYASNKSHAETSIDIDRNCDVRPIVEYSIETDDEQTLN
jgi:hypothetical protein